MKKFSALVSCIDIELIDRKIQKFIIKNKCIPCIFMSEETYRHMTKTTNGAKKAYDILKCYRLYYDNNLKFGEIKLRSM